VGIQIVKAEALPLKQKRFRFQCVKGGNLGSSLSLACFGSDVKLNTPIGTNVTIWSSLALTDCFKIPHHATLRFAVRNSERGGVVARCWEVLDNEQ
jgi:hypothetical protein